MIYQVRKAEKEEVDELFSLINLTLRESYRGYYSKEETEFFFRHHSPENIISDIKDGFVIIVLDNGKVIGTGTLKGTNIGRVFIHPRYQGRGIGRQIMTILEDEALNTGLFYLDLYASLPAKKFYESIGYRNLEYSSTPAGNNVLIWFYRMARMLKSSGRKPVVDLNNKEFVVLQIDGNDPEVDENILFRFFQHGEMIFGRYRGGKIIYGDLVGYIDNNRLIFSYYQANMRYEESSGIGNGIIDMDQSGRIRITNRLHWKSKDGEGGCIMLLTYPPG